jgi:PAS domain S-box-containing protein
MVLRNRLIRYNETAPVSEDPGQFSLDRSELHQGATGHAVIADKRVSQDDIRRELEKTGKLDAENQLNCGACGYDTCLEKARAVLEGMAESEMCVPYMKALAEKRTDRIIETSPNGIVILNEEMEITSINPAFKNMFYCGDAIIGRPISYLVDSQPFEQLLSGREARVERVVEYPNYQTTCHLIAYRLREEGRIVGIFVNVSELKEKESQIERIRAEAKAQAQELLQHQMKMAQDMTRFLGESTVKGEALVEKMMQLVNPRDV